MKTLNITFEDVEYKELRLEKDKLEIASIRKISWEKFFLILLRVRK